MGCNKSVDWVLSDWKEIRGAVHVLDDVAAQVNRSNSLYLSGDLADALA